MRILFFPNDGGGGFGHISMCLSFAMEAKRRGHVCAFSLRDHKFYPTVQKNFQTFVESGWTGRLRRFWHAVTGSHQSRPPLFTEYSKIDYLLLRDHLVSEEIVIRRLHHYRTIINKFMPDLLVSDTDMLAGIASQTAGIPLVQIVRALSHPDSARLIWWKSIPALLTPPDGTVLFNEVLRKNGLPPVTRTEALLQGDLYVVPGIPAIEPIDARNTYFVGALAQPNGTSDMPGRRADKDRPLIYITIGGGAGAVGNSLFFSTLIDACSRLAVDVVVSTGNKYPARKLPRVAENITFYDWVPGISLISQADLVIFHGGYATMMETLLYGKPSIVVPFHSEQESNGRRLEQLGCGIVMMLSAEAPRPIEAAWHYGHFNYLVQRRYDLTAAALLEVVRQMLASPGYAAAACAVQDVLRTYRGAEAAVELVEERWG